MAYVLPAAHQSFHSLCFAYRPWSGQAPTPRLIVRVLMSRSTKRNKTGHLPAVWCTEEEESIVRQKAADCGIGVGPFMLRASLGRQTRTKIDSQIINELNRLGGLQKHLFNEGGKGKLYSKEYAQILKELKEAIARIGV